MRWRVIDAGDIPAAEKGALLALLGSMERAESLIDRIAQERPRWIATKPAFSRSPSHRRAAAR